jgi:branched-chain amino acid transport system permease protein
MAYFIFGFSTMVMFVALAVLLHLQFGVTGIVNFGIAGFWGLGMYSFGVFLVQFGFPYGVSLLLATALTGVLAFALGRVILDMDGQAVLVATLAFATIVMHLVTTEKWLTEGVKGLGTIRYPFDLGRSTEAVFLLIVVVITIAIILYAYKLHSAPYGRLLLAIKDNETLARSLSKPTFHQKLIFFTITSTVMGFLGALNGSINQFLIPRMLGPGVTFTVWIALILGGYRRVLGGLIGAVAAIGLFDLVIETYTPIPAKYAQMVPAIKLMLYGLTLMLVILFRPLGILGDIKRSYHRG